MVTTKQLQRNLQLTFGIVPIVAGFDKFTNLMAMGAYTLAQLTKINAVNNR